MNIRKGTKVYTPDGIGIIDQILNANSTIFKTEILVIYSWGCVYHPVNEVHKLGVQPYTRMEMYKAWAAKS